MSEKIEASSEHVGRSQAKVHAEALAKAMGATCFLAVDNDHGDECFAVTDGETVWSAVYVDEPDCQVAVGDKPGRFQPVEAAQ